jgi:hypothetical protein
VLYRIYEQSGDPAALRECVNQYRKARQAWAELANVGKGVYMADITIGEHPQLRGHWLDRLPAMDKDIAAVEAKGGAAHGESNAQTAKAIQAALGRPIRPVVAARHTPASSFQPGQMLRIDVTLEKPAQSVQLYYRHVNQAERFNAIEMTASNRQYAASIPAEYTASEYPLEYYFELRIGPQESSLYPGLANSLTQQPYFVTRQPAATRKQKLTSRARA